MDNNDILDTDFLKEREIDPKNKSRLKVLRYEIDDQLKPLKTGRIVLYVLAVLSIIQGVIYYRNDVFGAGEAILIETGILAVAYISLAFFSLKYPKGIFVAALCIYITLIVVNVWVNDGSLWQGIIILILIIFSFAKAIIAAFTLDKFTSDFFRLGGKKYW